MSAISNRHPLDQTSFIAYPLETHPFERDPANDFLCFKCKRPRALHAGPEDFIARPALERTGTIHRR